MKFKKEHAGKWVASQDEKIIAFAKTLSKLKQDLEVNKADTSNVKFSLVPKGHMAG